MENKINEIATAFIELEQLKPMSGNRRIGGIPTETLEELAASIRSKGILQPLLVRHAKNGYEIIAGERRWRAAKLTDLGRVPCQVRDVDDAEAEQLRTIENLQREDLHPLDEAEAFAQLLERGTDVEAIAAEIGRSPAYIHQRMVLRRLISAAEKLLREGVITAGHGVAIARLAEADQEKLVKWVKEKKQWGEIPTIRELEEYARKHILLNLSAAAFKKDDIRLLQEAGSCAECRKRSGYQPALFADVGKADMCLDAVCFNKKLDLFLAQKREQLAGEDLVLVDGSDSGRNLPGTVKNWNLDPCRASEQGAKKMLIVAGPDRGKVGYTRISRSGARTSVSPAEKAKRARELAEQRIKREIKLEIYRVVVTEARERMKGDLENMTGMPLEVLRAIAGEAFDRQYERRALMKIEGWKDPNPSMYRNQGQRIFKNMGEPELLLSMLKCMIISAFANYNDGSDLTATAKAYDVDVKAIEKKIRAQKAAKATKKKPAAKAVKVKKAVKKGSAMPLGR